MIRCLYRNILVEPCGVRPSSRNAGCCHSLGGFDEDKEDDIEKLARADRLKEQRRQQEALELRNAEGNGGSGSGSITVTKTNQPTTISPMTVPNNHAPIPMSS